MNKKYIFILLFFVIGCAAPNYLYNKNDMPQILDEYYKIKDQPYYLQPYDYLFVSIRTTNKDINDLYENISTKYDTRFMGEQSAYLTGFMINPDGYVYIPYVGNIYAKDKTLDEVRNVIIDSLNQYITDAVVNVKLANFNIYFLGEVGQQGKIAFYKERVSILEALSKAGGINQKGNKRKVYIFRRQDTTFQILQIDLTKRKLIENENFFVKPNDIIYVPERPISKFQASLRDYLTFLTLISSTATTVLLIINLSNGK